MSNIILIGMMGSGKTTVGKLLAQNLGKTFIDLDEEIESQENRSIPKIFEIDGETFFRKLETKVLNGLENIENSVLATGGGAVLKKENVLALKKMGFIIYMEASIDTLKEHLSKEPDVRPILKTHDLEDVLKYRHPIYQTVSDIGINIDGGSPQKIVELILMRLEDENINVKWPQFK